MAQQTSAEAVVSPHDYSEIVVPLDGSDLAERALPVAVSLAREVGARVCPVTVSADGDASDLALPDDIDVDDLRVLEGDDVGATVVAHLTDDPGRLLAMTTRGRGRVAAGVLGSVAESILRTCPRPVLLVGPQAASESADLRRIIACVDGSPHSETILPIAARWARDLEVRLDLVQVVPEFTGKGADAVASGDVLETSYVRALGRWLIAEGVSPEWEVLHGRDPVPPILDYATGTPGSLIATATHGRSGWARVALGSVAMRVAHESPVPILVYRPEELRQG